MSNLYSTSDLKNRLQELTERVNETGDEVFIDIANEEIGYINEDIEYFEKNYSDKEDKKSDFEDVWERMDEFVEDYLDKDIFEVKTTALNTLRYEVKPSSYELSQIINNEQENNEEDEVEEELNPGKKSLNYTGYAFQAKFTCSSCGNTVFVNNIQDHVICQNCKTKKELNTEWWKSNLFGSKLLKEAAELEENTATTSTTWGGDNLSVAYGNNYPRCKECSADLLDDEYWTIKELETAAEKNSINCKKCNKSFAIRKPDNFVNSLFEYPIIAIYNEQTENKNNDAKSKVISLQCSSCGANLKIQENQHTSVCEYCNTENILPDSLFKPIVSTQQTFGVLLKQKHKSFQNEITKNNIDNIYWALVKIRDEKEEEEKEEETQYEELEEEKKKKSKISFLIGIGLPMLVFFYFIIKENSDLFGYAKVEEITNTDYSHIKSHNGYKWGVINNKTDEICIPTDYKFIEYFFKDYFRVKDDNDQYGIVNSKNEIIIPIEYNKITYLTGNDDKVYGSGYFMLYKHNGSFSGLYNNKGKQILPGKYYFSILDDYFIINKKDGNYGLADTLGNIVLPEKYFDIISIKDNKAKVKEWKRGKTYFVELNR